MKRTKVLTVNSKNPSPYLIEEAAGLIRAGELVAFPTETVYGLGANALDPSAVKKIFKAKKRPSDNPLIVHIAHQKDVYTLVKNVPPACQKLMRAFWPGPLTLIMKKSDVISDSVTASLSNVAIRMPSHPVARMLISKAGVPIAAPSANIAGRPSPTRVEDVLFDLRGRIAAVVDSGPVSVGLESTVVDVTKKIPVLLRPGAVTLEQLRRTVGKVTVHSITYGRKYHGKTASPGMKYTHYAPKARVILVVGPQKAVWKKIDSLCTTLQHSRKKVNVIAHHTRAWKATPVVFSSTQLYARNLFSTLRHMDAKNVDVILAEGVPERGLGLAIMNRLKKASSAIIRV